MKSTTILSFFLPAFMICPGSAQKSKDRVAAEQKRPAISQSKSRQEIEQNQVVSKRRVIVNLKDGTSITGQFIQADLALVQLEVASNILKIKIDDIINLVFDPNLSVKLPTQTTVPVQNESALIALRSLRKLAGATEVGIRVEDYNKRLIDAKNEFDEAMSTVTSAELKDELKQAMEAYVDAGQAWNEMIRYDFMLHTAEPGITLIRKYSLKPVALVPGGPIALPRNLVLTTLWSAAKSHIENAAAILANPNKTAVSSRSVDTQRSGENATSAEKVLQAINVAGTWKLTFTANGNTTQWDLYLSSSGKDSFIGAMKSLGGSSPIFMVKVSNKNISASFPEVWQGQQVIIDLAALIEGERLSGELRFTAANGQQVSLPISGNKVK